MAPSWSLSSALKGMFSRATIDAQAWDDLEDALISADFGPDLTDSIVEELRASVARFKTTDPADLRRMLRETLEERLARLDPTLHLSARPAVVLVVGVNGVGKTTTIGKFAKFLTNYGRTVVVGAADTFRAAAVEQLATWAERGGASIVRPQQQGQDPASVAFQTVERAQRDGIEIVLIDTAGRLQTKSGLMDELGKIRRVIEKQTEIAEVLLVLDARPARTGSPRPRRSSSMPASPASCSPSSTGRRRVGSCSRCRRERASRSSWSARVRASATSPGSPRTCSCRGCSTRQRPVVARRSRLRSDPECHSCLRCLWRRPGWHVRRGWVEHRGPLKSRSTLRCRL